jgi:hypothetical protein
MTETQKRTRTVNDIGLGMAGIGKERMLDFLVYEEGGRVFVKFEFEPENSPSELLQYLTPEEAMAFSKAFERCAIAALKNRA